MHGNRGSSQAAKRCSALKVFECQADSRRVMGTLRLAVRSSTLHDGPTTNSTFNVACLPQGE